MPAIELKPMNQSRGSWSGAVRSEKILSQLMELRTLGRRTVCQAWRSMFGKDTYCKTMAPFATPPMVGNASRMRSYVFFTELKSVRVPAIYVIVTPFALCCCTHSLSGFGFRLLRITLRALCATCYSYVLQLLEPTVAQLAGQVTSPSSVLSSVSDSLLTADLENASSPSQSALSMEPPLSLSLGTSSTELQPALKTNIVLLFTRNMMEQLQQRFQSFGSASEEVRSERHESFQSGSGANLSPAIQMEQSALCTIHEREASLLEMIGHLTGGI